MTSSVSPPPYEHLLPLPTPILRCFWKDSLMTPRLGRSMQIEEPRCDQEGLMKIDNKNQVSLDPFRSSKWIELDWPIHFDLQSL